MTSLAENYNFYNILAAAGIYPDNNRKLTDSEVRAAFASRLGSAATINYTCAKDGKTFTKRQPTEITTWPS